MDASRWQSHVMCGQLVRQRLCRALAKGFAQGLKHGRGCAWWHQRLQCAGGVRFFGAVGLDAGHANIYFCVWTLGHTRDIFSSIPGPVTQKLAHLEGFIWTLVDGAIRDTQGRAGCGQGPQGLTEIFWCEHRSGAWLEVQEGLRLLRLRGTFKGTADVGSASGRAKPHL